MRSVDEMGRAAGAELAAWDAADLTPPSTATIARRANRRRHTRQAAVGLVAVGLTGLGWSQLGLGDAPVETGPADDSGLPVTSVPPSVDTSGDPVVTIDPGAVQPPPATDPAALPPPTTCTAAFPYDAAVAYDISLPAGWVTNELVEWETDRGTARREACTAFGPGPVLPPDLATAPVAAMQVHLYRSGQQSFDQLVDDWAALDNFVSTERTTVDGHPAARFEFVDQVDGLPRVYWQIDAGDRWVVLSVVTDESFGGEMAEGLDAIVATLHIRPVP